MASKATKRKNLVLKGIISTKIPLPSRIPMASRNKGIKLHTHWRTVNSPKQNHKRRYLWTSILNFSASPNITFMFRVEGLKRTKPSFPPCFEFSCQTVKALPRTTVRVAKTLSMIASIFMQRIRNRRCFPEKEQIQNGACEIRALTFPYQLSQSTKSWLLHPLSDIPNSSPATCTISSAETIFWGVDYWNIC